MIQRRSSLKARPADLLYFSFFLIHLPATLFVDLQAIYPSSLVPTLLKDFTRWYVDFSGDPLIGGAFFGGQEWIWFRTFLWLEAIFQVPVFILGARALYYGPPISQKYYPLLLAYSASSSTTTLPCLATVLSTSTLTATQRMILLSSYIPFFLVPFMMAIDMLTRLTSGSKTKKSE